MTSRPSGIKGLYELIDLVDANAVLSHGLAFVGDFQLGQPLYLLYRKVSNPIYVGDQLGNLAGLFRQDFEVWPEDLDGQIGPNPSYELVKTHFYGLCKFEIYGAKALS